MAAPVAAAAAAVAVAAAVAAVAVAVAVAVVVAVVVAVAAMKMYLLSRIQKGSSHKSLPMHYISLGTSSKAKQLQY